MMDLTTAAGLALGVSLLLSAVYEGWRVIARTNVSVHDEPKRFVREEVPFYVVAFIIVWGLVNDQAWSLFVAVALVGFMIVYAILRYIPVGLPARKPGIPDNVECVLFLVGLGASAVLLGADLSGISLIASGS